MRYKLFWKEPMFEWFEIITPVVTTDTISLEDNRDDYHGIHTFLVDGTTASRHQADAQMMYPTRNHVSILQDHHAFDVDTPFGGGKVWQQMDAVLA
jgi:hypothetical protein